MRSARAPIVALGLVLAAGAGAAETAGPRREGPAAGARHALRVRVDPPGHALEVRDRIELEVPAYPVFLLHAGLSPVAAEPGEGVEPLHELPPPATFGLTEYPDDLPLEAFRVVTENGGPVTSFTVRYAGVVHHPLREGGEEYARAFSETPGTIESEGVYLAGSTFWYPVVGPHLVSFELSVETPPGWEAVSEGGRSDHVADADGTRVVWSAPDPTEEIHLVAGPWSVFEDRAGSVATYAYLREPDEGLARKYLEVTTRYLRMYEGLIGPYPYPKFALVENFWETGYGMPSFTLLGPTVIRLPFILHSSYPHEILHNWWGNGVFVAWDEGNWCEGLTAYLADHLIKEQRGEGAAYRRDLLQKYADYVREGRDFPLTAFRSRHSAATEAVGYGKTAMVFHMLRRKLGDPVFVEALRTLYARNRFRRASWDDVRDAFEAASGASLGPFFHAWVEREGAPALEIVQATATDGPATVLPGDDAAPFGLRLELAQAEGGALFPLEVDAEVLTADGERVPLRVAMTGRRAEGATDLSSPAAAVRVDSAFDLFRRLDPRETPASFGQAFGSPKALVVLPSAESGPLADAYRALAETWSATSSAEVRVTTDDALDRLPADRSVWIVGWDNRFRDAVAEGLELRGASLSGTELAVGGDRSARSSRSLAVAVRHPDDATLALVFLAADRADAVAGLGRKLPHYGKYGYLGFEGPEPTNVIKGQWPVADSPLTLALARAGAGDVDWGAPEPRAPLAELPPAFSEARMRDDVAFLAGDALAGRGCGSEGLARAADYIEERMREAGLLPGADDGTYRQTWTGPCGEEGRPATMVNLVGVLPGRRDDWAGRSVVVLAHYDHLGLGWPEPREGERGMIHNGADDNASGVAVLLELARVLAGSLTPDRSVVFLAVSGEESGLRGSRHYVASEARFPARDIIGALNLDTVGRIEGRSVLTLGAGSAAEWIHIVNGASYVTGTSARAVMDDLGSSDQKAFLEAGIPAVQLFTGPHLDYHRPTDDADRLDYAGMVAVAAFAREFVDYLAAREEPLSSTVTAGAAPSAGAAPTEGRGRRVSLGSVPDFAFPGPGCRLSGVVPGSPAEAAGLREGDVIVRLDGTPIEGLRDLSDVLKGHQPGDRVTLVYERDGTTTEVAVTLAAR